jgi:hypothetical protein
MPKKDKYEDEADPFPVVVPAAKNVTIVPPPNVERVDPGLVVTKLREFAHSEPPEGYPRGHWQRICAYLALYFDS